MSNPAQAATAIVSDEVEGRSALAHPGIGRRRGAGLGMLAVVVMLLAPSAVAGAATGAPYSDSRVQGYLGICNQSGVQVTSGSVSTTPFGWRVVSSQAAAPPYDGASRTATLFAYQPRQGFLPGEWSGEALTASSRYSNPAAPMTAATDRDPSLADFLSDYPASWSGFVQIRMYLGAAGATTLTTQYPALDLQVTGSTWQAVGGGAVDCHSGTSVSLETIVLPTTATTTTTTPAGAGATTTTAPPATTTTARASSGSSSGSTGIWVGLLAAAVVLLAGATAAVLWKRRQRPPEPSGPPQDPDGGLPPST